MNRRILGLAIPNIITNITVPLLGMVDMAIVGHLSATHIGAITIGTSLFNLIYWNFGFLRMGTSGFTAQAYGAKNITEAVNVVIRALTIALALASLLIILRRPIGRLAILIYDASPAVIQMALTYFFVRIWAAPATLGLYAIKGWFIGMQNSRLPMWIALFINVVNIGCSILFVIAFHWDIAGVALGTVIAQYSGLLLALILGWHYYGDVLHGHINIKNSLRWHEMRHFFKVNGDIFLRTICLSAVFTFITAASGRISDQILAIDALLLQFCTLFSYIMDGFAYAGESVTGRYIGARDIDNLRLSVRILIRWGLILAILFSILYILFGKWFLHVFTDDTALLTATQPYLFWTYLIPICSFTAFLLDGIYIGATASRTMRNVMFLATLLFFAIYYSGLSLFNTSITHSESLHNNILWTAFLVYMTLRGLLLAVRIPKDIYAQTDKAANSTISK